MSYYDREAATHLDGTRIFQTVEDRAAERAVAQLLEECWGCSVSSFGALAPIDWYAIRQGRMVGVLELKARTHASDRYPTVFLNVRKWLALTMAETGLGAPAIFVASFTDQVLWVPVRAIDGSRHRVAGCVRRVKADNDIEPVIDVDIGLMRKLTSGGAMKVATTTR